MLTSCCYISNASVVVRANAFHSGYGLFEPWLGTTQGTQRNGFKSPEEARLKPVRDCVSRPVKTNPFTGYLCSKEIWHMASEFVWVTFPCN